MGDQSHIQWTDATWNPVAGCRKVSPGCDRCYAMRDAHRLAGNPNRQVAAVYDGLTTVLNGRVNWTGEVRELPDRLLQPLFWRKPRRIFVNSMSDLFADGVSDEYLDQLFAVMALCPHHQFQVLTKRPERMRAYFSAEVEPDVGWLPGSRARWGIQEAIDRIAPDEPRGLTEEQWDMTDGGLSDHWPLPNVWLGTSVEDQQRADERIPHLLETPAAVRFLSCEPLISAVDLEPWLWEEAGPAWAGKNPSPDLHWVIIGGESGHGARPMDTAWAHSLIIQCDKAGVACFLKQLGSVWAKEHDAQSPKGGMLGEWPEHLQVREFPTIS